MPARRAFLLEVPGDPRSDYLKATLPLAPGLSTADALAVPTLTAEGAKSVAAALAGGKPVLLPREALPEELSRAGRESLSELIKNGLILCPMTELPRWLAGGVSCTRLLTLARLQTLAAGGAERIYLANSPAATPLAEAEAKRLNIHLTGGNDPGTGKGRGLGMVHQKK